MALLLLVAPAVIAAAPKTNFVLMMSDDTGWGDPGYNGGVASTPHLDAWSAAPSAVRLDRFYAGSPICSPTRASFLTGRTPWRDCIFGVEYKTLPRSENLTIAAAARSRGYRTAHFGKWHLGSLDTAPPAFTNTSCGRGPPGAWCGPHDGDLPVSSPLDFGFDTFCSTPQCAPSAAANCVCAQRPAAAATLAACNNTGHYNGSAGAMTFPCQQYYVSDPSLNGSVAAFDGASKDDDNEHLMDQFVGFMDSALAQQRPFLAVIWFHSVHIPYVSPLGFREPYAAAGLDANAQDYYGALTAMDAQIGRLRATLRQRGIADDTFLLYTADNGPEGQWTHATSPAQPGSNPGSTGGLRGRKRDLTEGGIREPGLLEWPAVVKANVRTSAFPAGTVDIKPTVLDILGVDPLPSPARWPLDGTSLVPLLRGEVRTRAKPMGWVWGMVYGNRNRTGVCGDWGAGEEQRAIEERVAVAGGGGWDGGGGGGLGGDGARWPDELAAGGASDANQVAWVEGSYKLFGCNAVDGAPLRYFLYDLDADPAETVDLSARNASLAAAMRSRLDAWIRSVAASRGPAETNCAAPPPPTPAPPTPPGPFTPVPAASNCTYQAGKTMPGSQPVRQPSPSQEACCTACFDTTWCVVAIFVGGSCNMHTTADVHPLVAGGGAAVTTGRVPLAARP